MLDRLHFLVHALHRESLVLAALVPSVAAVGDAIAVLAAVLHGRESVEPPCVVEEAYGDAAPGEESHESL